MKECTTGWLGSTNGSSQASPRGRMVLAALVVAVVGLPAQSAPQNPNSIRNRMQRILKSPQFRNLVPLKRQGSPMFRRRGQRPPGGGSEDGQGQFQRDKDGNPVIVRDKNGRAKIGKDNDGRAVIGKDRNGRDVILKDQQGKDIIVRDGKVTEEILQDRQRRDVIVRDNQDRAKIGKDRADRAVIGKDRFGRDVILRDEQGRDVIVRDGPAPIGDRVQRDGRGRPILFRDENGRAKIRRDQQGRAVLGKDEQGRDVVLRDNRGRQVAARNQDGRNGVLRDRRGRPVIFRDENGRADFNRNQHARGVIGRDENGRNVRIRDQKGKDVIVLDPEEFKRVLPEDRRADGPFNRNPNNGGNNDNRPFDRNFDNRNGGNDGGGNRNFDAAPQDSSTSSSSSSDGPGIRSTGFGTAATGFLKVIGWIVTAIVAGLMLYVVAIGIVALIAWYSERDKEIGDETSTETNDPLEPDTSPGELPADVYIQRARELASAGKFREAIAQLLLGSMSNLERAGIVKYRKGLTHRDYVRASRSQPQLFRAMRGMVRLYEPLGFGRRTPLRAHFEQSLTAYEAGFRAAPTAPRQ